MNPLQIIEKYYDKDSMAYRFLTIHGEMVAKKALEIAKNVPEIHPDTKLIEEAAMLHDIGIFAVNAPEIGCLGKKPYIMHGLVGADILRKEGLPLHARICERHLGTGITRQEMLELNLPAGVYESLVPETVEEEIVCLADKFYSKIEGRERQEKSFTEIEKSLVNCGENSIEKFKIWLKKYGLTRE